MAFLTGKYIRCFRGLLLGIIYTCFYLVQLVYVTGPDNLNVVSSFSSYKAKVKQGLPDDQQDHVKKTKLILNKRFQPPVGDVVIQDTEGSPVRYYHILHNARSAGHYPIFFILVTSLRGPPATTLSSC